MKRLFLLALVATAGVASAQISNGGFETGDLTGWTVYSSNGAPGVTNISHTGQFAALLGNDTGGEPLGDSAIYQQFTVGAGGGTLSFWHSDFTTDSITFDWQDAYILDSSGNNLATIFHNCDNTSGYVQQTVNMSPYAGQTVRIAFLVHQDGFGDDTSMKVDDVTFTPVPEPASMAVLGIGALALIRRRRNAK